MKCVGCDATLAWDGKGLFSYTCPCGATIFYDEAGRALTLPCPLFSNLAAGQPLPHLDDLVGESSYSSPVKEEIIAELRRRGFIWMRECEQCQKDGTLARRLEQEKALAVQEAGRIIKQ